MDLTKYIPKDSHSWIPDMKERIGEDSLLKYYNRVFVKMFDMNHQESFSIIEKVDPENYELFIKCAYTCIFELASYGRGDYFLEQEATLIYRS